MSLESTANDEAIARELQLQESSAPVPLPVEITSPDTPAPAFAFYPELPPPLPSTPQTDNEYPASPQSDFGYHPLAHQSAIAGYPSAPQWIDPETYPPVTSTAPNASPAFLPPTSPAMVPGPNAVLFPQPLPANQDADAALAWQLHQSEIQAAQVSPVLSRQTSSSSRSVRRNSLPPPAKKTWIQRARRQAAFMNGMMLLQVILMVVEIWVNGGFAPFSENPLVGPSLQTLVNMGAKDSDLIREGQVWRWFAPMFLHGGLIHLAFILLSEVGFANTIEKRVGFFKIAAIFLLSGIAGTVASALLDPFSISVGASGAVFGLVGSVLPFIIFNWSALSTPFKALFGVLLVVLINLIIGLTVAIVDNWAHLGGLVMGFSLGLLLVPTHEKIPSILVPFWHRALRVIGACVAMLYFVVGFSLFYCNCIRAPGQLRIVSRNIF